MSIMDRLESYITTLELLKHEDDPDIHAWTPEDERVLQLMYDLRKLLKESA